MFRKKFVDGHGPFYGNAKYVNGRFLIHGDEQLKQWKKHFNTMLSRITFGEVPPTVNDMARRGNPWEWITLPRRSEIVFSVNLFRVIQPAGAEGCCGSVPFTPWSLCRVFISIDSKILEI